MNNLSKCLTGLYRNTETDEENNQNDEDGKNFFDKFSNKMFKSSAANDNHSPKNSEFKDYKDNFSRNESRSSMPDMLASFHSKKLIENTKNYKINPQTKSLLMGKVYNFLERPSGWLCFIYHFTV